jgi:FixJ family two-component response regulator
MAESTRFVVAVVDDDERALESLADLLEAAGYDVRLYSSAKVLWEHGSLSDIDCLISDVSMAEMNGVELRRRALSKRPDLPVFLITGRPEVRAQYPSLIERDFYFEKPFDGEQLLAAIRKSLTPNRSRPAEE